MQFSTLQSKLAQALDDPTNEVYTTSLCGDAISTAVREYSRYRPCKRRVGSGSFWQPASIGDTVLKVVGGLFLAGQTLYLSLGFPEQEVVIIQSVALASLTPDDTAVCLAITLTAPIIKNHVAGSFLSVDKPGFSILSGKDTYALPFDWIKPELESFNLALGKRSTKRRTVSAFDGAYDISSQLSSIGISGRNDIGPILPGQYPYGYDPANAFVTMQTGTDCTFLNGNISVVVFSPIPGITGNIDFYYYGQHVTETVPDSDENVLINRAMAYCFMARLTNIVTTGQDWTAGDEAEKVSARVLQLRLAVKQCMDIFDTQVRKVCYVKAG